MYLKSTEHTLCIYYDFVLRSEWSLINIPGTVVVGPKKLPVHCHASPFKLNIKFAKNELSSVITQTVPSESTHRELSFEWSHLRISLDSSGFRRFLGLVKFTFGSKGLKYP